jgi:hypothetical protein
VLTGEDNMREQIALGVAALLTALLATGASTQAFDDPKYPDWKGAWARFVAPGVGGQPSYDQTRPWGFGQQAPLTAEYQKVLADSIADQAKGGLGNSDTGRCLPGGMPRAMIAFQPLEFIITGDATYILINANDHFRRIFTDGRDWPQAIEPTYDGYSIGRWIDQNGEGRYGVLEVETRGPFKGPRAYDASGLPLHFDNQSIFVERIHLDRADPNILHDEITVIDHALTRPWTADKKYVRDPNPRPDWFEFYCTEGNHQVVIGQENYFLGAEGVLMPTKKDQPPPDLRYFKPTRK